MNFDREEQELIVHFIHHCLRGKSFLLPARYAVHISRAPASHKFLPFPPYLPSHTHTNPSNPHNLPAKNSSKCSLSTAFLSFLILHLTPIKPFKHPLKSLPLHLSSSNTFHRY